MDNFQGVKETMDKILEFLEVTWGRVDLKAIFREVGNILVQVFNFMADIVRWFVDKI